MTFGRGLMLAPSILLLIGGVLNVGGGAHHNGDGVRELLGCGQLVCGVAWLLAWRRLRGDTMNELDQSGGPRDVTAARVHPGVVVAFGVRPANGSATPIQPRAGS